MAQQTPLAPTVGWIYDLILRTFALAVGFFFREVQVRGAWRVPSEGAIILVAAPHSNQFVDSIVLMKILRSLNRRISWLMAEKSFQRKFVGFMAKMIGAVPVSRAMDIAKSAPGKIYLEDSSTTPKVIKGIGTDFTSALFKPGGSIYLPTMNGDSQKLDNGQIIGPDTIILKNSDLHPDALFQLTGRTSGVSSPLFEGTKFKVAPHVDQTEVYNAVFERLAQDGCIGIFPEGGSHDRTQLLPLKAGIAIMALGALAQNTKVTIVPVGLTYFTAHKFRSRAVIEFGESIPVSEARVQDFKNGKKRDGVGGLMNDISQALAAVTMSAPDFETLNLIHAARRLYLTNTTYSDEKKRISLAHSTELNRRLVKGYTTYSQTPEMKSLIKDLKSYMASLKALNLKDHQLLSTSSHHKHFPMLFRLPTLLYRLLKLGVLGVLTLPGLLLFAPIFILTPHLSRRKTAEALAASSVKIRGHDVMATWKILIALALAPIFYTFYTILLVVLNNYNHLWGYIHSRTPTSLIISTCVLVLPMITYAALLFGEQGMDLLKSIYPLVLTLSPTSSHIINRLMEQRRVLVIRVREMIDRFGSEIFPDCDDVSKWRGRGPRKLYADISPETEQEDLWGLDEFV
ncbi:uncharacterized protein LY89DRAFT_743846 [Mollisia scopiformis]|uniref:Phospholipid/glycerol acyltransferase domain-containing protein n=1 Tax=Mollisia scopiformis TaxID=149040 RepID=A0A132B1V9_MOLSC|nr:uncharacterized protein LY89DRAFT_743846 [Mollisia scopiformis]KUJ06366.1 hypothetical protein LY89DRAFT_743846 [Mollisia scopiformis]